MKTPILYKQLLASLWLSFFPSIFVAYGSDSTVIKSIKRPYRQSIRVKVVTEKEVPVSTPGNWLPISFLVKDGEFVQSGEIIAKFDPSGAIYALKSLQIKKKVIESDLERRLIEIDNKNLEMQDRLDSLKDLLAYKKARLKRYEQMPLPDEVKMARGRLRIAKINYNAAYKDYERAKLRYKNELISKTELESFRKKFLEKKAKLRFAENDLKITKTPGVKPTIMKLKLENASLQLEINKLTNELKENENITKIQKERVFLRKRNINMRIKRKRREISNTTIKAEISGFVSYQKNWRTKIDVGVKLWKNYKFLAIPDIHIKPHIRFLYVDPFRRFLAPEQAFAQFKPFF